MPTLVIEYGDDAERLLLEQAIAFVSQMRKVADNAADGTVIAACEQLALSDGRQLLCDTLASAVQGRAQAVDAKKKRKVANRRGRGRAGF